MANYPQELTQNAVCQSDTGHMNVLWFRPSPTFTKIIYGLKKITNKKKKNAVFIPDKTHKQKLPP